MGHLGYVVFLLGIGCLKLALGCGSLGLEYLFLVDLLAYGVEITNGSQQMIVIDTISRGSVRANDDVG